MRVRWIMLVAVVGCVSPAALAFQETQTGSGSSGAPAKGSTQQSSPATDPRAGVNLDVTPPAVSKGGQEIRIPGLGKVGVLPKLDFGLELLYGANEPKGLPDDKSEPSDLQLRGTLKYKY